MGLVRGLVLILCCSTVLAQFRTIPITGSDDINDGSTIGQIDGANWMKNNINWLGQRTLKEICIPGSHNSGMSMFLGGTRKAMACNTVTQSQRVLDQLKNGVRYLDVRPVMYGGRLLTGNYRNVVGIRWHGANGLSIDEVVEDINTFTRNHNELIIVRIYQPLILGVDADVKDFTQQEWNRLFQYLDRTNYLFNYNEPYLTSLTLGRFTLHGTKPAVLYIIDSPTSNIKLGRRWGNGYFVPYNFRAFMSYSNTNDVLTMAKDQVQKMSNVSPREYFMLTWILSQTNQDVDKCYGNIGMSIQEVANKANSRLRDLILPEVRGQVFPNILLVENVKSTNILKVAMEINLKK